MCGPSGGGKSAILDRATRLVDVRHERIWLNSKEVDAQFRVVPPRMRVKSIDDTSLSGLMDVVFGALEDSHMKPSQRLRVLQMVAQSAFTAQAIRGADIEQPVVHDELLLNRAFSALSHSVRFEDWSEMYFRTVPPPDAAVVVTSTVETLRHHIVSRPGPQVNVYRDLDPDTKDMTQLLERLVRMSHMCVEILGQHHTDVLQLDSTVEIATNVESLIRWVEQRPNKVKSSEGDKLRLDLLAVSESFKKGKGRHTRRHTHLPYSSFVTPRLSVLPGQGQRDAQARVAQFDLSPDMLRGGRVLDLGCHTGGMLLHMTNYEIAFGLGIEYDADKVELARRVAEHSRIEQISFKSANIDALEAEDIGQFDIVLALAIEGHVENRERLFDLLGKVTLKELCFEGNSGCDVEDTMKQLHSVGFDSVWYVGPSIDDIDPRNHNRPVFRARKSG